MGKLFDSDVIMKIKEMAEENNFDLSISESEKTIDLIKSQYYDNGMMAYCYIEIDIELKEVGNDRIKVSLYLDGFSKEKIERMLEDCDYYYIYGSDDETVPEEEFEKEEKRCAEKYGLRSLMRLYFYSVALDEYENDGFGFLPELIEFLEKIGYKVDW